MQDYLEHLIYLLASHSNLVDRRITVAIINDPTINAFAVPGGIIGVNLGLFLNAESESEISAILAHEIAHISQRHFARRTEASRKASVASMVGLRRCSFAHHHRQRCGYCSNSSFQRSEPIGAVAL